jgi:hypothetical protein
MHRADIDAGIDLKSVGPRHGCTIENGQEIHSNLDVRPSPDVSGE